jgi:hypothetical protein
MTGMSVCLLGPDIQDPRMRPGGPGPDRPLGWTPGHVRRRTDPSIGVPHPPIGGMLKEG